MKDLAMSAQCSVGCDMRHAACGLGLDLRRSRNQRHTGACLPDFEASTSRPVERLPDPSFPDTFYRPFAPLTSRLLPLSCLLHPHLLKNLNAQDSVRPVMPATTRR